MDNTFGPAMARRRVCGIPVAFDNIVTAVRVAAQLCGEPSYLAEAVRSGPQPAGCCDSKLALNQSVLQQAMRELTFASRTGIMRTGRTASYPFFSRNWRFF